MVDSASYAINVKDGKNVETLTATPLQEERRGSEQERRKTTIFTTNAIQNLSTWSRTWSYFKRYSLSQFSKQWEL